MTRDDAMETPPPGTPHAEKAYKNLRFLNSSDAREIRVLCEFVEPRNRFRRLRVRDTVVFFGSARTPRPEEAEQGLRAAERELKQGETPERRAACDAAMRQMRMSRYFADAADLADRLTRWSESLPGGKNRFVVCSGGGPGIMEAANLGAYRAGGKSIGLNISLPMEQFPNPYQSQELTFEFHYFFIRKFWFVYLAKALIAFPGGFGTFDELFEVLTLIQTDKTSKRMPVVVYGSEYWKEIIDFDALVKWGVISPGDLDLIRFCDTVDDAFEYLKEELSALYL